MQLLFHSLPRKEYVCTQSLRFSILTSSLQSKLKPFTSFLFVLQCVPLAMTWHRIWKNDYFRWFFPEFLSSVRFDDPRISSGPDKGCNARRTAKDRKDERETECPGTVSRDGVNDSKKQVSFVWWIRAAWWSGSLWLREHKSSLRHGGGGALRRSVFVLAFRTLPCRSSADVSSSRSHRSFPSLFRADSRAARRGRDEEAFPRRTSLVHRPLQSLLHTTVSLCN